MDNIHKAVLLLGPTGTGKTPLGQQLETRNLWGKSYRHFDFGEELRKVSSGPGKTSSGAHAFPVRSSAAAAAPGSVTQGPASAGDKAQTALTEEEIAAVKKVLETNALLTDSDFPIAEKLLTSFIRKKNPGAKGSEDKPEAAPEDVIILNGLPRHTGQAEALSRIVDVRLVILLESHPDVIKERIKSNSGGDRSGRTDDSVEEIDRKLAVYREQTLPLIEYYKKLDRTILEIEVETDTIPLYIIQGLETMPDLL